MDPLPEILQSSRSLLVIDLFGGTPHQLDIRGPEAKWLLAESEGSQGRPGRWRDQDAVVSPVHDYYRVAWIQPQLGHVLGRVFLVRSRLGFCPLVQVARRLTVVSCFPLFRGECR
jgi:hypothetical protein